jgi:hypothetical protein
MRAKSLLRLTNSVVCPYLSLCTLQNPTSSDLSLSFLGRPRVPNRVLCCSTVIPVLRRSVKCQSARNCILGRIGACAKSQPRSNTDTLQASSRLTDFKQTSPSLRKPEWLLQYVDRLAFPLADYAISQSVRLLPSNAPSHAQ